MEVEKSLQELYQPYVIDPFFVAGIYRLYRQLFQGEYQQKIFYITSGNSLGYFKYGGHFPWDDDLDVGFLTDPDLCDYLNFLKFALQSGFEVNLHLKNPEHPSPNWWENKESFQLLLQNEGPSAGGSISVDELDSLLQRTPDRFYFANVSLSAKKWLEQIESSGQTGALYYWDDEQKYLVTPWIDFMPFFASGNLLESFFQPNNVRQPSLSNRWIRKSIFETDSGPILANFPADLRVKTIKFYNENRVDFGSLFTKEQLYCHLLKSPRLFHTYTEEELSQVWMIVSEFNQSVSRYLSTTEPVNLKSRFDELAERYDDFVEKAEYGLKKWLHSRKSYLIPVFEGPRDVKVLDLGCGNGYSIKCLRSLFKDQGLQAVGIDYSEKMVQEAVKSGFYESVIKHDLSLPLAIKGTFKIVLALGVLEFLKDEDQLFEWVHQKMDQESIFICSFEKKTDKSTTELYGTPKRLYTKGEIYELMERNQFEILEIDDCPGYQSPGGLIYYYYVISKPTQRN